MNTIKQERIAKGLTITELALLAKVSRLTIYKAEKGKVKIETLNKIKNAIKDR
jgi:predicted transcriptional regulator